MFNKKKGEGAMNWISKANHNMNTGCIYMGMSMCMMMCCAQKYAFLPPAQ